MRTQAKRRMAMQLSGDLSQRTRTHWQDRLPLISRDLASLGIRWLVMGIAQD